jgi:hypothetical protein
MHPLLFFAPGINLHVDVHMLSCGDVDNVYAKQVGADHFRSCAYEKVGRHAQEGVPHCQRLI